MCLKLNYIATPTLSRDVVLISSPKYFLNIFLTYIFNFLLQRKEKRKENEAQDDVATHSIDVNEAVPDTSLEEPCVTDKTGPGDEDLKIPEPTCRNETTGDLEAEASNVTETQTEFDVFGKSVAAQLNSMPWENAVELQLQIQKLITRYRLTLHRESRTNSTNR